MIVLQILIAVLLVLIAMVITIGFYLFIENKTRGRGGKIHTIIFLACVFVIAFVLRAIAVFYIYLKINPNVSFLSSIAKAIELIYSTSSGMTFEGQDLGNDEYAWCLILYHAGALWLALTYITVISLGVSYQFSSMLRLKIKMMFFKHRKSKIFIFTSATEDSINLADSIVEHYAGKEEPLIIFANDDLEPFDRDLECHRDIKSKGYIYFPYYKNKDTKHNVPIISHLASGAKRHFLNNVLTRREIKVFAMKNNAQEKGLESANSDIFLQDVEDIFGLIKKDFKKESIEENLNDAIKLIEGKDIKVSPHIDYYILSNSTVNHEFYEKRMRKIIEKFIDDEKVTDSTIEGRKETYFEFFKSLFQIHVLNESYMTGEDLIRRRRENEIKNIKEAIISEEEYEVINESKIRNINGKEERSHVVLVLGFGQNGQMALNNLLIDTSYLHKEMIKDIVDGKTYETYVPSRFVAHIFDVRISSNAGVFEHSHPLYLFNKKGDKSFVNENEIRFYYGIKSDEEFTHLDNLIKFPHIHLHDKNCKDLDFLEDIDTMIGSENKKMEAKDFTDFDTIIIALGDDEENIQVANAILQDLRQELYHSNKDNEGKLSIFVNIRDSKNKARLNWQSNIDGERFKNVFVTSFGSNKILYSYDNIVDVKRDMFMEKAYSNCAVIFKDEVKKKGYPKVFKEFYKDFSDKNNEKNCIDVSLLVNGYLRLSNHDKLSNRYASYFTYYFSAYLDRTIDTLFDGSKKDEVALYLAELEHLRWMRFHIAYGFTQSKEFIQNIISKQEISYYNSYINKKAKLYGKSVLKMHSCLLPYNYGDIKRYLDEETYIYDYSNVAVCKYIENIESFLTDSKTR